MSAHPRGRVAVALLASILAGCEPAQRTASQPTSAVTKSTLRDWVADPLVVEAQRDANCPRLLSAAPNVTEICCALGLRECLVGRTRYCTYPPDVQSVRSIGALNDLNVETLLEIKPDLIIVSGFSRAITEQLTRLGLSFQSVPDFTLDELFVGIERIGDLTGRRGTARRLAEGIRADLDTVAARFVGHPPVRVLLLTDPLPDPPQAPFAAGPGSFYDDLLRRAGHSNAAAASGRPFAPVALEFVLAADPDVILELAPDPTYRPGGDADALRVWAKVGPLKAVTAKRVHVLAGTQYSVLGPRIAQTFEALCEAIAEKGR